MKGAKPKERLHNAVQKSSEFADSFTDRLWQSWRGVLAGAALVLSISLLFLWTAFARPFSGGDTTPQEPEASDTSTESGFFRTLDGMDAGEASSTNRLPFAVMVENGTDAWPLSGPARANLVFEAPVEGSITRFMLVFDPSNDVTEIGPVRSARPYYVDWADGLDAMYAHVGGSPAALAQIRNADDFRDLDQFSNGGSFWRSSRPAPHNVFTKTELLMSAMLDKEYEVGTFRSWLYEDAVEQEGDADISRINVPYQGAYEVRWEYDAETSLYTRWQNDSVQKDADGEVVKAKNVVVILSDATVVDREGRLNLRTTGRGKALVFHDGKQYEGEWKRSTDEHIRFETVDGRDIPFARGTTWISVLTSWNAMNQVVE
jgi:hypothetical protein